jgi:hypothetical protein
MKVPEFLKTVRKYVLVLPALKEDLERRKEINEYVITAIRDLSGRKYPNNDLDFVLNTLKREYKSVGLFSHAAKMAGVEKIKMEVACKELKRLVDLEVGMLLQEEQTTIKRG